MKTIHVAGGSFFTATEIADALMSYSLELARAESLDVVEIPFVDSDGAVARAQFRVGWRIDTIVTSTAGDPDELVDVDATFAIIDKTQMLQARRWEHD
ncbi:hypothetical protein [Microbacterium deminutum]|uniref:Uncharacterized protein n=1 Tax=Microbacterium deminutum TaxID=344164 RepID=A0ABN2R215_9MICO